MHRVTNRGLSYILYILAIFLGLAFFSVLFTTTNVSADTIDTITITIPVSCTIDPTINTAHTANISNNQYIEGIGTTTLRVSCNDDNGYSIYAIGYSDDTYGNTEMISGNTVNPSSTNIVTGTATSGDTSNWAMKLTPIAGTFAPTIVGGYDNYSAVPATYTKVATFNSLTDSTVGSSVQSTYAVFVSRSQGSGTYTGKVKYTIVHPADNTPVLDAYLDSGSNIAAKISGMTGTVPNNASCSSSCFCEGGTLHHLSVEAIKRSSVLPNGFVPSDDNTISLASSPTKVYMWFDNTNNTIYYYTDTRGKIYMNEYPKFVRYDILENNEYYLMPYLSDISGLSDWDASRVVSLAGMFSYTSVADLAPISNWNVSNVKSMSGAFSNSKVSDLTPLANWDVSNVTDMWWLFGDGTQLGDDSCTDTDHEFTFTDLTPLANWDVSNVTSMYSMFRNVTTLVNSEPIKNWDVRKVTIFDFMFGDSTPRTNLPIFTSRPGTWNNNGTYTPNP